MKWLTFKLTSKFLIILIKLSIQDRNYTVFFVNCKFNEKIVELNEKRFAEACVIHGTVTSIVFPDVKKAKQGASLRKEYWQKNENSLSHQKNRKRGQPRFF